MTKWWLLDKLCVELSIQTLDYLSIFFFLRNWIGPKVTEFLAYWVSEALLVFVEIHLRPMCTNWLCMPIALILAALDCWLLCLFWLEVSLAASWIAMHRQVRERFAGVWFSFLDPLQTSQWLALRCHAKFSRFTWNTNKSSFF